MHGPLSSSPHETNAIKLFFGGGARETSRKPLDFITASNQTPSYVEGENFGTAGLRIARTAPVQD
jgi:hypothetical protein